MAEEQMRAVASHPWLTLIFRPGEERVPCFKQNGTISSADQRAVLQLSLILVTCSLQFGKEKDFLEQCARKGC